MKQKKTEIREGQEKYYSCLLKKHGVCVDAVASGNALYKQLRYKNLCKVFEDDKAFSLFDVGFGLGHMHDYIREAFPKKNIEYSGAEVTPKFVEYCRKKYPESRFYLQDIVEEPLVRRYDYIIFAGTFYHIIDCTREQYFDYVKDAISNAFTVANKGVAFNLMTSYVDYELDGLFYADMHRLLDYVVKDLSRFFTVWHNYPLYEYTLHVYTEDMIATKYPEIDFQKYYKKQSSSRA